MSQLLQALTLRLLLCVKVLFDFSGQRRITSGYIQVRKILQKTHHKPICEPHIRTPAPQCSMQYSTLHGVFHLCDAHMHACTYTVAWQATGPSQITWQATGPSQIAWQATGPSQIAWQATGPSQISVPQRNWQAGQL